MAMFVGVHDYNHKPRKRRNVRGRSENYLAQIPRVPYIIPEIARAAF